jgi:phage shock protein PspC (stress-responsive transcriptional regulator)
MALPIVDIVLTGKSVFGSIVGTRNDLAVVFSLHAAGRTTVIAEDRKLDDVNEAMADVLSGGVPARVVFRSEPSYPRQQPSAPGSEDRSRQALHQWSPPSTRGRVLGMTTTPLPRSASDGAAPAAETSTPRQSPPVPGADLQRPPLRRSRNDSVVSGVCGGLAAHTGIEAMLWRIGFIALAVAGPGIPLYLLLWLLLPACTDDPAAPEGGGRLGRLRKGMTPSR